MPPDHPTCHMFHTQIDIAHPPIIHKISFCPHLGKKSKETLVGKHEEQPGAVQSNCYPHPCSFSLPQFPGAVKTKPTPRNDNSIIYYWPDLQSCDQFFYIRHTVNKNFLIDSKQLEMTKYQSNYNHISIILAYCLGIILLLKLYSSYNIYIIQVLF